MIIKFETIEEENSVGRVCISCLTPCQSLKVDISHNDNKSLYRNYTKVGSHACKMCEFNSGTNYENQTVDCLHPDLHFPTNNT